MTQWQSYIQTIDLPSEPSRLQTDIIYPLYEQAFIQVAGADASKFLQGQLSCDVNLVTNTLSSLGSHSTAKGRMQSSFRLCKNAEDSYLFSLHHSIKDKAKAAFSKYIVFSKAEVTVDDDIVGIGLHGNRATKALQAQFSNLPTDTYAQSVENNTIIICTSSEQQSYEIYCHAEQAITLWPLLSETLQAQNPNQYRLLQHALGLAFVETNSYELFIPQMLNYQATPAISFTKGCYTGQEIVARMHYLGKSKRRMYRYTADCAAKIKAGDEIFIKDKPQSSGNIASAVKTGKNQWDLLIVLTDESTTTHEIIINDSELQQIENIELPYQVSQEKISP